MMDESHGASSAPPTTNEAQAVSASNDEARAFLVLWHAGDARALPLTEDQSVIIGRQWPANVVLDDLQLSRQHARIVWTKGGILVEDLNSRNGTVVRGAKTRRAVLQVGEQVTMGRVVASVHVSVPANSLPTRLVSYDGFGSRLNAELLRARKRDELITLIVVRGTGDRRQHVHDWWPRLHESLRPTDTIAILNRDCLLVMQTGVTRHEELRTAEAIVANCCAEVPLVCGVAMFPECGRSADELMAVALEAAHRASASQPVIVGGRQVDAGSPRVIVKSPKLEAVHELAQRVAKTDAPVLILGETGSGKEVLANLIHRTSRRAAGPHVAVNCAAFPVSLIESVLFGHVKGAFTGAHKSEQGIFEQAHTGTVFLDEIGELSPTVQAMLLRVLDTQQFNPVGSTRTITVDLRIVAATNRDIERMVESGEFRRDLWYRLNTVSLEVPSLRERYEDVGPLAELFIQQASARWMLSDKPISEAAMEALLKYEWPGNVRELRNVMERALLVAGGAAITRDDLPERIRSFRAIAKGPQPVRAANAGAGVALSKRVAEYEAELIVDALNKAGGNVARAAGMLGMSQRTLTRKISRYNLARRYSS